MKRSPASRILLRRDDVEVCQRHRDDLDGQQCRHDPRDRRRHGPGPQPPGQQQAQRPGGRRLCRHRDVRRPALVEPRHPRRGEHPHRAGGEVAVVLGPGVPLPSLRPRADPSDHERHHDDGRGHGEGQEQVLPPERPQPPERPRLGGQLFHDVPGVPAVGYHVADERRRHHPDAERRRRTDPHSATAYEKPQQHRRSHEQGVLLGEEGQQQHPSQPDPAPPGARPHTDEHRGQEQREEQGVDAGGVGEGAADAVGRGVETRSHDPRDGAAAGAPHDEGQEHQDGDTRRDRDHAHRGEVDPGELGQRSSQPEVERGVGPRRVLRGGRPVERLTRRDPAGHLHRAALEVGQLIGVADPLEDHHEIRGDGGQPDSRDGLRRRVCSGHARR